MTLRHIYPILAFLLLLASAGAAKAVDLTAMEVDVQSPLLWDNEHTNLYQLCLDLNANTTTLLQSMRDGAPGYSGIMANFHPELYVWLCNNIHHPNADKVQQVLSIASLIERQLYPVNAKYHLRYNGIRATLVTRLKDDALWNDTFAAEVDQLHLLEDYARAQLGLEKR